MQEKSTYDDNCLVAVCERQEIRPYMGAYYARHIGPIFGVSAEAIRRMWQRGIPYMRFHVDCNGHRFMTWTDLVYAFNYKFRLDA